MRGYVCEDLSHPVVASRSESRRDGVYGIEVGLIFRVSKTNCLEGFLDLARGEGLAVREFGAHTLCTIAFAYYNYDETNQRLEYTAGTVQPKYFNNDLNFPQGYRTTDDHWENYWREGQNAYLNFDVNGQGLPGEGFGAKSMGEELANSEAFASCQVKKVFKAVCLRDPEDQNDFDLVDDATDTFTMTNYSMRQVFADVAVHCRGQ